jgi:hypothetical protein
VNRPLVGAGPQPRRVLAGADLPGEGAQRVKVPAREAGHKRNDAERIGDSVAEANLDEDRADQLDAEPAEEEHNRPEPKAMHPRRVARVDRLVAKDMKEGIDHREARFNRLWGQ